jgi:alpha-tubulin suppressor-like RCC1 family protein
VSGLTSNVTAIEAGGSHTCAVVGSSAQCWGRNFSGELGDGTTSQSKVPVQVSGLTSNVTVIKAGSAHTCAVVGGSVQCWGVNTYGQLGDGTAMSAVPVAVLFP